MSCQRGDRRPGKIGWTICLGMVLTLWACEKDSSLRAAKTDLPSAPKVVVEKKEPAKEVPPPPEVKIKLKRDGKDQYSWELSGTDVDQILKVNEKLKRNLGGEKPQASK